MERLQYPLSLRRRQVEGIVYLQILLTTQGEIETIEIIRTSESNDLDLLAIAAVKEAAPFNISPSTMGRLKLRLPIEFKLTH